MNDLNVRSSATARGLALICILGQVGCSQQANRNQANAAPQTPAPLQAVAPKPVDTGDHVAPPDRNAAILSAVEDALLRPKLEELIGKPDSYVSETGEYDYESGFRVTYGKHGETIGLAIMKPDFVLKDVSDKKLSETKVADIIDHSHYYCEEAYYDHADGQGSADGPDPGALILCQPSHVYGYTHQLVVEVQPAFEAPSSDGEPSNCKEKSRTDYLEALKSESVFRVSFGASAGIREVQRFLKVCKTSQQ